MIPTKTTVVPPPVPRTQRQYGGVAADALRQRALALERKSGHALSGEETDSMAVASDHSTEPTAPPHVRIERVVPRIFGFPVHETSRLMAWQERKHEQQMSKIAEFHRQKLDATQQTPQSSST